MPRPRTVYRGKRKYSWIITLAVFVLVALILVAVWLFSYLQRFLVYDKESLQLVLPSERTVPQQQTDGDTAPVSVPKVDVEIVVDRTDYSALELSAGEGLSPLRGLFVAAEDVTEQNLDYYAGGIGDFDALVLEMKGADGFLRWHSAVPLTDSYGVNGTLEPADTLAKLKAKDVRLVAEISALTDVTMATRNCPVALKNAVTGGVFQNSHGAWLDPFSDTVRTYLADLMTDLAALGFDEVLLSGLFCPAAENLQYSQEMAMTPDTVSAIGSLAYFLRQTADSLGLRLSAVVEAEALANGESDAIGQDVSAFFNLFDRIVYDASAADAYLCQKALEAAAGSGDIDTRIVPVTDDYAPDRSSYIVR